MTPLSIHPFRKRVQHAHEIAAGRTVRDLFEQHGRMVHAICRLNLRDRLDAEDATQQTFLSAHRSLLGGREPKDPPAWLATIARNECSRVRRQRPITVPIDESERARSDVVNAVEQREEIEALAAALSELPPSQRDAVVLREFYGLSYQEVSAVLGVSGPAVESLLFKGRRRLQEKLGSLRVASAIVLPDTVRDSLAQALPGFGSGVASTGSTVVALPVAAKVAAVAVVVAGGGVTVADNVHREPSRPAPSVIAAPKDSTKQRAAHTRVSRPPVTSAPARTSPPTQSRGTARLIQERAVQNVEQGQADTDDERDEETGATEQATTRTAGERDAEREKHDENDELAEMKEDDSSAREEERDEDEPGEDTEDDADKVSADDTADSDSDDPLDD